MSGVMSLEEIKTIQTKTIYWKWPYQTGDTDDVKKANDKIDTADSKKSVTMTITVTGTQRNPGVVIAKEGDRIKDIIEKAGGTTEKADLKNINLAYKVEDGQKINIPNIDENKNENVLQEKDDEKNKSITNNTNNKNAKNVNHITKSSGTNVIVDGNNNDAESKSSKVNINTATQTELETLNGIGPSTASKIIKYRNEKGKFKKIEDIKNVSGIGEAKFKKIEADIVV